MDLALVKFVGAGLTTLAPSLGVTVPVGAVAAGDKLVVHLLETHPQAMRGIIESVVRDIWVDWRRSGLPMSDAGVHLDVLPQLMDDHRPPADLMLGAYAVSKSGSKHGRSGVLVPARKVASAFIIKARETKVFVATDLNESIAFFLLERLFVQLLMSRNWVDQLVPAFDDFFYKSLWRSDPGTTAVAHEPQAAAAPVAALISPPPVQQPFIPTPTLPHTSAVALRRSISSIQRDEPKNKAATLPPAQPAKDMPRVEPKREATIPRLPVAEPAQPMALAAVEPPLTVERNLSQKTVAAPEAKPTLEQPAARPVPAPREGLVTGIARALSWIPRPARLDRDAAKPIAPVALAPAPVPTVPVRAVELPPVVEVTEPTLPSEVVAFAPPAEVFAPPEARVEPLPVPAALHEVANSAAPIIVAPLTAPPANVDAPVTVPTREVELPTRAATRPVDDFSDILFAIERAGTPAMISTEPAASRDAAPQPASVARVEHDEPAMAMLAPTRPVEPTLDALETIAEPVHAAEFAEELAPELEIEQSIIDTAPVKPRVLISELDLAVEEQTMLPATVCAALRTELTARLGEELVDRALLVRQVEKLIAVVEGMRPNAGLMSRSIELREAAIEELLAGDIAKCGDWLLEAEEEELAAAEADPNVARLHRGFASEIRVAVAEIDEACGDFRRAAVHLGAAERNVASTDRMSRWTLLIRQARMLLADPDAAHDATMLKDAIAAYRRALSVAGSRDTPSDWANVHREVASLLINKSATESSDEPLHAALEHLGHAIEAYSRSRASDEWAETLVTRGTVLSLLAGGGNDATLLLQAAEAFRAALGPLSQQRTPKSWAAARAHLGLVLKRLAEIEKVDSYLLEAVTNLRTVVDADIDLSAANGLTLVDLASEFGEATQMLAVNRDDPGALVSAAAALAEIGPRLRNNAERIRIAEVVDQLGGSIWRMGGKRQDAEILGKAAKVKQGAISEFEQLGEHDRVRVLNGELERLHDFMMTVVENARLRPRDVARTG